MFETKTPIYILTGVIITISIINTIISLANIQSNSGNFITDVKDNIWKYFNLDFLASDSTKKNPLDEIVSSMDDITL